MSFAPALPLGGFAGWRFLERTEAGQRAALARDPRLAREVAAFRARIGSIATPEALLADRTLLGVALGAFGLEGEIGKTAFLRKLLAEGTENPQAFANRLVDRRYHEFARAFGFGDSLGPATARPGFADRIAAAYLDRSFEVAVGAQQEGLRIALAYRRDIGRLADAATATTAWFRILGDRPVRTLLATALGLPEAAARLPVEKQAGLLAERARRLLGAAGPADLARPETVEAAIRRFLAVEAGTGARAPAATGPGANALALLARR
jgi:hypothetical protein